MSIYNLYIRTKMVFPEILSKEILIINIELLTSDEKVQLISYLDFEIHFRHKELNHLRIYQRGNKLIVCEPFLHEELSS